MPKSKNTMYVYVYICVRVSTAAVRFLLILYNIVYLYILLSICIFVYTNLSIVLYLYLCIAMYVYVYLCVSMCIYVYQRHKTNNSTSHLATKCRNCNKITNLSCAACRSEYYCSKTCQIARWVHHKLSSLHGVGMFWSSTLLLWFCYCLVCSVWLCRFVRFL
jgi:hypothetical protein